MGRDYYGGAFKGTLEDFNPRAPRGARPRRLRGHGCTGDFNPRAPRGARPRPSSLPSSKSIFQSTRPAWGATVRRPFCGDFYGISIHAPRVGRDSPSLYPSLRICKFQSTRPAWGATTHEYTQPHQCRISIHAPRVGRDASACRPRA